MESEDTFDIFFADSVAWDDESLMAYADFAEYATFVLQTEHADGQLSGYWWHGDEPSRTVYGGIHGLHNSPGASGYTWAVVFDELEHYEDAVARCKALPEYMGNEPVDTLLDVVTGRHGQ